MANNDIFNDGNAPRYGQAIGDTLNKILGSINGGGGGGGGSVAWGGITGTLSNQTDLQAALDAKADQASLDVLFGYNSITVNEETTGTINMPLGCKYMTQDIRLGDGGGGSYLMTFNLSSINRTLGDKVQININFLEPSVNPSVEVYDDNNILIYRASSNGIARNVPPLFFTFDSLFFVSDQGLE